jgi:ribose 5-phosphate isomerase B
MKIAIGNDRKGLGYKQTVVTWLQEKGYEVVNVGTDINEPCDYPIYAEKVARLVSSGECEKGIVICASGIGISIAANKVKGIRCGVGYCDEVAKAMRLHNDANIIAFGQEYMSIEEVINRVELFLNTDFLGSYHLDRVKQIEFIEENS